MPVGAFLFLPDASDEPLYAIICPYICGYAVRFYTLQGRPVRGKGLGRFKIPYEIAKRYGRFVPLVAVFAPDVLPHGMRHTHPKIPATAAHATGNGESEIVPNGDGAKTSNAFVPLLRGGD